MTTSPTDKTGLSQTPVDGPTFGVISSETRAVLQDCFSHPHDASAPAANPADFPALEGLSPE